MVTARNSNIMEILHSKSIHVCRNKLIESIKQTIYQSSLFYETVYDLDSLVDSNRNKRQYLVNLLRDNSKIFIQRGREDVKKLQFESRFESGNLRKAIRVGLREYELILTPDVNSSTQHQWFYFEVSNMETNYKYTFNIVNCKKINSQFNFGMKPVIFSVIDALKGRIGWTRSGQDICYYQNNYCMQGQKKNYFTTSFTINFPHSEDICYIAYHYPYTYSQLMVDINRWARSINPCEIYLRVDKLCDTLNGNENPLLTITAPESTKNPINKRKLVFLTARIHPGESNASWIMLGTVEALLSHSTYASSLRNDYIFKVVPMLNIEGVINGC
ncbi:cytosolic carboxypeptidase 1-like isoform X2 [Nasonia vitripennis]|nr:cytosolic carboxypeptidase 1-like isoform X2 [Nasonia vitripennis]